MPQEPASGTSTTSNVKIYDRPQRKGISPLLLAVGLLILLAVGFFTYRAFSTSPSTAPAASHGADGAPAGAPQTAPAERTQSEEAAPSQPFTVRQIVVASR